MQAISLMPLSHLLILFHSELYYSTFTKFLNTFQFKIPYCYRLNGRVVVMKVAVVRVRGDRASVATCSLPSQHPPPRWCLLQYLFFLLLLGSAVGCHSAILLPATWPTTRPWLYKCWRTLRILCIVCSVHCWDPKPTNHNIWHKSSKWKLALPHRERCKLQGSLHQYFLLAINQAHTPKTYLHSSVHILALTTSPHLWSHQKVQVNADFFRIHSTQICCNGLEITKCFHTFFHLSIIIQTCKILEPNSIPFHAEQRPLHRNNLFGKSFLLPLLLHFILAFFLLPATTPCTQNAPLSLVATGLKETAEKAIRCVGQSAFRKFTWFLCFTAWLRPVKHTCHL